MRFPKPVLLAACLVSATVALAQNHKPRNEVSLRWNHSFFIKDIALPAKSNAIPMGLSYTRYNEKGHGWMLEAGYQKQYPYYRFGKVMDFNSFDHRKMLEASVKRLHSCFTGDRFELGAQYGLGYRFVEERHAWWPDCIMGASKPYETVYYQSMNQLGASLGARFTYRVCEHFTLNATQDVDYFRTLSYTSRSESKLQSSHSDGFALTTRLSVGYRF